jgi:hypothetical protein
MFSLNQSGWRQLETCRFNIFCVMFSWWSCDGHVTHTKNLAVITLRGWKCNSKYHTFWLQQYLHVKSVDVSFIYRLEKVCVSAVGTWPNFTLDIYIERNSEGHLPRQQHLMISACTEFSYASQCFASIRFCFSYAWRQTVLPRALNGSPRTRKEGSSTSFETARAQFHWESYPM